MICVQTDSFKLSPNQLNNMKGTKTMLAVLATLTLTWLSLSTAGYFLSDDQSFRQVAGSGPIWFLMLVFGWIPCVVVGIDMDEKLS